MSKVRSSGSANYAKGGASIGKVSEFMKSDNEFTENTPDNQIGTTKTDEVFGKGGGGQAKGPSNPVAKNKKLY